MKLFKSIIIGAVLMLTLSSSASAALLVNTNTGKDQTNAFQNSAGLAAADETTAPALVATLIKAFLSLLGVIFVVLIIIAGFKWMNAGGNEKDVEDAQTRIKTAIIGLIIILSAYAITAFVFSRLPATTGAGDGTVQGTGG
jgi:hypothetical protein